MEVRGALRVDPCSMARMIESQEEESQRGFGCDPDLVLMAVDLNIYVSYPVEDSEFVMVGYEVALAILVDCL
jgi:hypothetical protein